MLSERASGILLHPTSLPGPHGIGDLGPEAYTFVDYLLEAGQRRWQVLPLGPTGYADSPYASFSSFAGNPLLISLELLTKTGDLPIDAIQPVPSAFSDQRVQYGPVIDWKFALLRQAAMSFREQKNFNRYQAYRAFCEKEASWLDDYALFMTIKKHFDEQPHLHREPDAIWNTIWDRDIAYRESSALAKWRNQCEAELELQKILQFFFFEQWRSLKRYANERDVQIIGDLPIYVALDSSDVWSAPETFRLDENLIPILVAGVPPDYFAEDGQRWGNPLYDWEAMKRDRFRWWVRRFQGTCALVDFIRVDHFRGFESGYSIPRSEPTAKIGDWIAAPGIELFEEVQRQLGELPILAEDLGLITREVELLRDRFQFPGMRVLQFAFNGGERPDNHFLPHNHTPNSAVYSGTHDNDTTLGWYRTCSDTEKKFVSDYVGHETSDIAWDLIRMAFGSVARLAVVPMQDVLRLGSETRMNFPSTVGDNWQWRMPMDYRKGDTAHRLAKLVKLYDR